MGVFAALRHAFRAFHAPAAVPSASGSVAPSASPRQARLVLFAVERPLSIGDDAAPAGGLTACVLAESFFLPFDCRRLFFDHFSLPVLVSWGRYQRVCIPRLVFVTSVECKITCVARVLLALTVRRQLYQQLSYQNRIVCHS